MAVGKSVSSEQRKRKKRKEGFSMVIVEHRLRQVRPHVNRVLVMREGRIVDDTRETERMLDADWLARHYVNGGRLKAGGS